MFSQAPVSCGNVQLTQCSVRHQSAVGTCNLPAVQSGTSQLWERATYLLQGNAATEERHQQWAQTDGLRLVLDVHAHSVDSDRKKISWCGRSGLLLLLLLIAFIECYSLFLSSSHWVRKFTETRLHKTNVFHPEKASFSQTVSREQNIMQNWGFCFKMLCWFYFQLTALLHLWW